MTARQQSAANDLVGQCTMCTKKGGSNAQGPNACNLYRHHHLYSNLLN
jgi:hypothetical protein